MNLYLAGFRGEKTTEAVLKMHKDFLCAFLQGTDKTVKLIKKLNQNLNFLLIQVHIQLGRKKKEVDIDEYIDWLNDNDEYIDICAQLDCIPGIPGRIPTNEEREYGAKKTWENYIYMIQRLKSPKKCLFTIHLFEDSKYLKQFLETDFSKYVKGFKPEYMAFGGMGNADEESRIKFISNSFDIISKSTLKNIKVHLFGVTTFSILEKFPQITSVDSTSWIMTAAMGSIFYKSGTLLLSDWQLSNKKHLSHRLTNDVRKEIERFGFTIEQLQKDPVCRCIYKACFLTEKIKNIKYKPLI